MDRSQTNSQLRMLDGYDQIMRNLLHTINVIAMVFAILVASTFWSFSRPPQSLTNAHADNSIDSSIWRRLFIYFNGASFFSSVSGLLVSASSGISRLLLPIPPVMNGIESEIAFQRKRLAEMLPKFFYDSMFLILSLSSFAVAYVFAGLATFREWISEQVAVIISCVVGGVVFIQALWVCVREVVKLWREIRESHAELWHELKRETLLGNALTNYVEKL